MTTGSVIVGSGVDRLIVCKPAPGIWNSIWLGADELMLGFALE